MFQLLVYSKKGSSNESPKSKFADQFSKSYFPAAIKLIKTKGLGLILYGALLNIYEFPR